MPKYLFIAQPVTTTVLRCDDVHVCRASHMVLMGMFLWRAVALIRFCVIKGVQANTLGFLFSFRKVVILKGLSLVQMGIYLLRVSISAESSLTMHKVASSLVSQHKVGVFPVRLAWRLALAVLYTL